MTDIASPSVSVSVPTSGLSILKWRRVVREFARNAKDSTEYTDVQVDLAIQGIIDDFLRYTHCVVSTFNQTLTAAASAFTITGSTPAAGFLPERMMAAYIPSYVPILRQVDYSEIVENQVCKPSSSGKPRLIAFVTQSDGEVFPTPDIAYTAQIRFWQPWIAYDGSTPSTWLAGDSGANNYSLNVPDDYLRRVLQTGGPAALQYNQPEQGYAAPAFALYREYRQMMSGAGGLGAKSIKRLSVDDIRRERLGW